MKIALQTKEMIVSLDDRITDSAHASTLLSLRDGSVLAAWFGGSWEKDANVSIYLATRKNGKWSSPLLAAQHRGIPCWNPVLFRYADGRICLFYKVGATIPEWKTYTRISSDEGISWSESEELVKGDEGGGRGPVKNKPILLSDGKTIIAPASLEGESWNCFVDISDDNGTSWEKSSLVPVRSSGFNIQMVDQPYDKHRCFGKGIIQPTLWEDGNGVIHMYTRSTSSAIFESTSSDKGRTWTLAEDTGIPNNNSGLDLVKLPSGSLVLACNPVGNLPNYYKGPRTPISLLYSKDNGKKWKRIIDLETEPGGYAYPAIIARGNDEILLTYTHKRETITFCALQYEE